MDENNKYNSELHQIMIAVICGEATADEKHRLNEWLASDSKNTEEFEELKDTWENAGNTSIYDKIDKKSAWHKINSRLDLNQVENIESPKALSGFNFIKLSKIAAVLTGLVIVGTVMFYLMKDTVEKQSTAWFETSVEKGQHSMIVLPDGTKVWLNSETTLKYSANYGRDYREVQLDGEAYFEVKKNPQKPFFVQTSKAVVTVYGTTFNVSAYKEDKTISATLLTGQIGISLKNTKNGAGKNIIMKPNQKALVSKENETIEIENIEPAIDKAWTEGKLVFDKLSFEELAKKLERKFDVKIHFTNPELKSFVFAGNFNNENLQQILYALKLTSNFNYEIKGKEIYIKK